MLPCVSISPVRTLLDCRDDHGRLALHWAAASGHADLVALLLGAAKAQKAAVEAAPEEADPALLGLVGKPIHDIQVLQRLSVSSF